MLAAVVTMIPMKLLTGLTATLTRRTKWRSYMFLSDFGVIPLQLGVARQTVRTMPSTVAAKQFNAFGFAADLAGFSDTLSSWFRS